ncbi:MAG: glycosyltransferase family 2 protein [Candidatus Gastranaerophilales bacterium]|nr:glycosyltransferase family 2 protein [Candidatus Gastranaerophilales bacterium]
MPRASAIMPVYNTKEEYLQEAIESILNQTFGDFEFIILNDCSTTNVEEIILSYKDKRIKYYKNEVNLGISESTNKLISLSQGDLILMSDHDDISLPQRFEKQIKFMDEHFDVGVLSGWFEFYPQQMLNKCPETNEEIVKSLLFGDCVVANSCAVIRKSLFTAYNLKYESEYNSTQDYRLWTQLMCKTKFANLQEVLLKYRWHDENFSVIKKVRQRILTEKIMLLAQQEHFGIHFGNSINVINKLLNEEEIQSKEFEKFIETAYEIKQRAEETGAYYVLNNNLYKFLCRSVKKDFVSLKTQIKAKFIFNLLNSNL